MKFLLALLLSISLISGSCRMPDDVGIGANGSQYDFLGASEQWPLTNDQGLGYGLNVWASWSLSPKKFIMVAPERDYNPFEKPASSPIVINNKESIKADSSIGDHVVKISNVTKGMTGEELTFWATVLAIIALTAVIVGPRVLDYLKAKKSK